MFDMVLMDKTIKSSDFWKNITSRLKCSCESYLTLCSKSILQSIGSSLILKKYFKVNQNSEKNQQQVRFLCYIEVFFRGVFRTHQNSAKVYILDDVLGFSMISMVLDTSLTYQNLKDNSVRFKLHAKLIRLSLILVI